MSETESPVIYFVPPTSPKYMEWGESILVIFFLAILFVSIILIYININIDEYQNRISVISNSYLFGINPQEKFKKFITDSQMESIATVMNKIESSKTDLDTTTYRLDDKAVRVSRQVAIDSSKNSSPSPSADLGRSTFNQIKDIISKLSGSLLLSSYSTSGSANSVSTTRSVR
jgi:hypothetical protein